MAPHFFDKAKHKISRVREAIQIPTVLTGWKPSQPTDRLIIAGILTNNCIVVYHRLCECVSYLTAT